MKIKIKKKQVIDEMSGVSGGSLEGSSGSFGDPDSIDGFNKSQKRNQRLEGDKLVEMFSSTGLSGRNKQQLVSAEREFAGHRERSLAQGLQNFKQYTKKRTFRVKIKRNPRK